MLDFSHLKILDERIICKVLEYQPSKEMEKDAFSVINDREENPKNIEKDFYLIINKIFKIHFINGFLNFLSHLNEDDEYRLALECSNPK